MRKHFLILMLLALLPLTSWAQFAVHNYVPKGNFIYEITQAAVGTTPGRVVLYGVRDGYDPVSTDSVLTLEGKITIGIIDGPSFDFVVDYANADALKNTFAFVDYNTNPTKLGTYTGMTRAKSVVIPKEFLTIKQNTFYGYTNMKSISFEANSEVTTIENGAFNTTQIRLFDFSNCSKLTALGNGVFVEAAPAINSYVKRIILPVNSTALTTIGTAFQRLTKLEAIDNLDQSLIDKVEAKAFYGDAMLKYLSLPTTVVTIENGAFAGSGIEDLKIDVTSLTNLGQGETTADEGNVYFYKGTTADPGDVDSKTTLKKLTLKGELSGTINKNAFKGCTNLATVKMDVADSLFVINNGTIGESAFEGCNKLAALSFNDITEGTIGVNAFKGCTSLASLRFAAITGTTARRALIDDSAFEGCTKLATINFSGALEKVTIDTKAFAGCTTGVTTGANLSFLSFNDVVIFGSDNTDGAFKGCTGLTSATFGESTKLNINPYAFYGCTKLNSVLFGLSTDLTIGTSAFENFAQTAGSGENSNTLRFGDATNLQIAAAAFKGASKLQTIRFGNIEDDATPSVEIASTAFEGAANLNTITFGNLTGVKIATNAFNNCSTNLSGTKYATITFGNLENTVIESYAFNANATTAASDAIARFNTVKIGDITGTSKIGGTTGATNEYVFGNNLKTVTIGNITAAATVIADSAFVYGDHSDATLNLAYVPDATDKVQALELTAGVNPLVGGNAFNFTRVIGGTVGFVYPVVTIGEIKTADALAAGALKGNKIAKIVFAGDIAAGALNNKIIINNGATGVNGLALATIEFEGKLATGAICANAFAGLPADPIAITFKNEIAYRGIAANAFAGLLGYATITFSGKLAEEAVAAGAFEGLIGQNPAPTGSKHSLINYTYNGSDIDLTVNPFAKRAFDNTTVYVDQDSDTDVDIDDVDAQTPRVIQLSIKNEALKAKFFEGTDGLGTDGAFDIYRVIVVMPLAPDWTFVAYRNQNSTTEAWARMKFGSEPVNVSVPASNLKIQRVQTIGGIKVKLTIYGTYTDEDDANQKSTVYMVPLKAQGGYYYIPVTNEEVLIAKVEGASAFEGDVKVPVTALASIPATVTNSIWTGLTNTELHIAGNIMTNQQLVDGTAVDNNGTPGDLTDDFNVGAYIHNTGDIYRHLYIMTNPASHKGFRFSVNDINDSNNVYINEGWYYMLLKNYGKTAAEAAAHIVWMDDATEGEITGIFTVKDNAKNVAAKSEGIYTLQGVRVSEMQKGQIYIVNGKKYIAK